MEGLIFSPSRELCSAGLLGCWHQASHAAGHISDGGRMAGLDRLQRRHQLCGLEADAPNTSIRPKSCSASSRRPSPLLTRLEISGPDPRQGSSFPTTTTYEIDANWPAAPSCAAVPLQKQTRRERQSERRVAQMSLLGTSHPSRQPSRQSCMHEAAGAG